MVKNETIKKIVKKEIKGIFVSSELEELLIRYTHATKLKELTKIRKEWGQENITEYIKFLAKNKNYSKVYQYYSHLCEVAHPNIGTNLIFYNASLVGEKLQIDVFSKRQNLNFFLNIGAYPLNISCEILVEGIKEFQKIKLFS
jgi:oligoribonuclease NrnB/cAMP/cGMP phosphodiesterase (DHH superfamily)